MMTENELYIEEFRVTVEEDSIVINADIAGTPGLAFELSYDTAMKLIDDLLDGVSELIGADDD